MADTLLSLRRHRAATRLLSLFQIVLAATLLASPLAAQRPPETSLVELLATGGYVIVMRHASSPGTEPDAATAAPGNVDHERQLDDAGIATAAAMGDALKKLHIPIGEVLVSPRFRTIETAKILDLGEATPVPVLSEGDAGMSQSEGAARSAALLELSAKPPPAGTNRLIVTHSTNLLGAFGTDAAAIAEGESLIVRPHDGHAEVVGRITIEQWPQYAAP